MVIGIILLGFGTILVTEQMELEMQKYILMEWIDQGFPITKPTVNLHQMQPLGLGK